MPDDIPTVADLESHHGRIRIKDDELASAALRIDALLPRWRALGFSEAECAAMVRDVFRLIDAPSEAAFRAAAMVPVPSRDQQPESVTLLECLCMHTAHNGGSAVPEREQVLLALILGLAENTSVSPGDLSF